MLCCMGVTEQFQNPLPWITTDSELTMRPPVTTTSVPTVSATSPAVGATGTPAVTDPSLEPLASFTILVDSKFYGPGAGKNINGYDSSNHRYDPAYINPSSFEIRLDATLGLNLYRSAVPLAARARSMRKPPTTVADFMRVVASPETGGDNAGGSSSGPSIPTEVLAFKWTIEEVGGPFVDSQLVMRPVKPMQLAVFQVPNPGRYRVKLQVVLNDGRQAERRVEFSFRDWLLVSIGDSFASGQGNPELDGSPGPGGGTICTNVTLTKILSGLPFVPGGPPIFNDPIWTEKNAWRSMRSGPGLAAKSQQYILGATTVPGAGRSSLDFEKIVFASFARTGAGILDGLIGPQEGASDYIGVGQLEECRRTIAGRRIDALMISIGGNDLGFAGTLEDLVKRDSVFRAQLKFLGTGDDAAARRNIQDTLDKLLGVGLPAGQIGDLEVRFNTLHREVEAIRTASGIGEIYITGYPTDLFYVMKGGSAEFKACGVFTGADLDISPPDGKVIKQVGLMLNMLLERKAREFGWHFIDIEADFAGRGYCASDAKTYWVRAEESCRRQGDFNGMMHPNRSGQAAYALRLSEALRKHTFQIRPGPRRAARVVSGTQPTRI